MVYNIIYILFIIGLIFILNRLYKLYIEILYKLDGPHKTLRELSLFLREETNKLKIMIEQEKEKNRIEEERFLKWKSEMDEIRNNRV